VSPPEVTTTSVADALEAATDALRAAGIDSPRLDAEVLLAEASGLSRARLNAAPGDRLDPASGRVFADMVRRRLRREPVAYIVGHKGFRHIELAVDPRVLIPRPESELLVELALELEPSTVLDVGTGSGAIALAVAHELPEATVMATDIYPETLDVARANAERLGLAGRVTFAVASLPRDGSFDLLLANLPYVSGREWAELAPELRDFEPRGALTPGPTGLEAFEAMLGELSVSALDVQAIGLEVGEGQWSLVAELTRRAGFEPLEVREDLRGIERVVIGRR
jgi:release factor glutamine methyltransferase